MDGINVDRNQFQGVIRERNAYRKLLKKCFVSFNEMPNNKVYYGDTYDLATEIEQTFKYFDPKGYK